jgi:transposase-like protein
MRAKRLTAQQKQEIFHALVTTQDMGMMTVSQSVQHVAKQFEITEPQLRQIEEEGIDKEWPPLNEAVQPVSAE